MPAARSHLFWKLNMYSNNSKAIIISAPSGAGKTTIVHNLLKMLPQLEFSVSATSREKRPNEINGKDYFFISENEFRQKIKNEDLLEWQEVYPGCFYGTLKAEVEKIWHGGRIAVFDVDVIGGLNLKKILKENALALFIMTPGPEELEKRLKRRGTETDAKLAVRLAKAKEEMTKAKFFDKVVINDSLPHALGDARQLVQDFLNQ